MSIPDILQMESKNIKIVEEILNGKSITRAALDNNICKQRASQLFHKYVRKYLFSFEYFGNDGKPKTFKELRKLVNSRFMRV